MDGDGQASGERAAEEEAIPEGRDEDSHPWRRYGARSIDIALFGLLFMFLAALVLGLAGPEAWLLALAEPSVWTRILVLQPLVYACACVGTALCLPRWGKTPGKWLFGLEVLGAGGERLTWGEAARRELNLFLWGVGFGLAPLTLVMLVRSYFEVENGDRARWDRSAGAKTLARTLEGRTYAGVAAGTAIVILLKVWDTSERMMAL